MLKVVVELVRVTYYISLYGGAKRLVFHLRPRDGHVIIVSGCLILTAINLIVLIRMVYITKKLVKLWKIYCDIWHRLTWSVCTGGRTLRHNLTKFSRMDSLTNFLTHGASLRARFARARAPLLNTSIDCVSRANELKYGRRRRGRNLWSNQANSPASKFVLRCFICRRIIFSLQATFTVYKGGEYYLRATFDRKYQKYRPSSGKSWKIHFLHFLSINSF